MSESPSSRFMILDHTADLRVRLQGRDPADLMVSAAKALAFLLMGGSVPEKRDRTVEIGLDADGLDEMLVCLVNELVFVWEVQRLVLPELDGVMVEGGRLRAKAMGFEPDACGVKVVHGVKAATYSGLHVGRTDEGLLTADMILDV